MSLYRGLVQKSNESEPEHSIVYVNEVVPNASSYLQQSDDCWFSLKASRNFTSLIKCVVGSAVAYMSKRLHPELSVYDLEGLSANGEAMVPAIYLLTWFLLADKSTWLALGALLNMTETDTDPVIKHRRF